MFYKTNDMLLQKFIDISGIRCVITVARKCDVDKVDWALYSSISTDKINSSLHFSKLTAQYVTDSLNKFELYQVIADIVSTIRLFSLQNYDTNIIFSELRGNTIIGSHNAILE